MGTAIEFVGMAIVVVGSLVPLVHFVLRLLRNHGGDLYNQVRECGRALLLGLGFLVAGDIIQHHCRYHQLQSLGLWRRGGHTNFPQLHGHSGDRGSLALATEASMTARPGRAASRNVAGRMGA